MGCYICQGYGCDACELRNQKELLMYKYEDVWELATILSQWSNSKKQVHMDLRSHFNRLPQAVQDAYLEQARAALEYVEGVA